MQDLLLNVRAIHAGHRVGFRGLSVDGPMRPCCESDKLSEQENANHVSFYDPANGKHLGSLQVGFLPHEIAISKDGKTAYAKVIKGGNDEINDKLQERFENMPLWTPATRGEKNVAIKLKQSLEISR